MSYQRDFAGRIINNRIVEGYRARQKTKETLKKAGAAVALGLLGLGFYIASTNQIRKENSIETRIKDSPRYEVNIGEGETLSDCYKQEFMEHGAEARNAYMERSKEKFSRRKLTVPDVDRDGYVCGKVGTRVD